MAITHFPAFAKLVASAFQDMTKQDGKLSDLSEKELQKRIAALE